MKTVLSQAIGNTIVVGMILNILHVFKLKKSTKNCYILLLLKFKNVDFPGIPIPKNVLICSKCSNLCDTFLLLWKLNFWELLLKLKNVDFPGFLIPKKCSHLCDNFFLFINTK